MCVYTLCACVCTCICIHVNMCMYAGMFLLLLMYSAYVCVCICVHLYVNVHAYVCVCMYVCLYACMHACMWAKVSSSPDNLYLWPPVSVSWVLGLYDAGHWTRGLMHTRQARAIQATLECPFLLFCSAWSLGSVSCFTFPIIPVTLFVRVSHFHVSCCLKYFSLTFLYFNAFWGRTNNCHEWNS